MLRELIPVARKSKKVTSYEPTCVTDPNIDNGISEGAVRCHFPRALKQCNPNLKGLGGFSFKDDEGTSVELDAKPTKIVAHVQAASTLWDMGYRCGYLVAIYGPQERSDHHTTFGSHAGPVDPSCVKDLGSVRTSVAFLQLLCS